MRQFLSASAAVLWGFNFLLSAALGQNTAFTYQGRLNAGGSPANGVYDFAFQAFDAPTAGSSIGGTANVNGVGVSNGLFTAVVDLGSSPFTGPTRWLQIHVSTNGAGSFTTLTPRQPLTPSPYAIYANTAGTVTNGAIANTQLAANAVAAGNIQNNTITAGKIASGQVVKSLNGLTDAVSLTQGANVTINTVGNSLQISAPAGGLNLPFSGSASSTGPIFTLANSGSGPAAAFLGRVGIGTPEPRSKLTVWTTNSTGVQEGLRINNPVGFGGTGNGSAVVFSQDRDPSENFVNATIQGVQELIDSSARGYLAFSTKSAGDVTEKMRITGAGKVGIGTTTPSGFLDVLGTDNSNILFGRRTGGGLTHNLFIDGSGNGSMQLLDSTATPRINLGAQDSTYFNYGNVGIGTTTPQARLEVRGDIRLGSSGQFRAASGDENLRIVRGTVAADGSIIAGSGFSVTRNSQAGSYTIRFNTLFASPPSVTGSVEFINPDEGLPHLMTDGVTAGAANVLINLGNQPFHFIAIGPR